MLELRVSQLDVEFIKLWSEYILEENPYQIMDRLKKLAIKGQLNAIATWYNWNNPGDCEEIDNIVKSLKGFTYDELFALGKYNQTFSEQKENLKHLFKDWETQRELIRNNFTIHSTGRGWYKEYGDNTEYENELNLIRTQKIPEQAPFFDYYYRAYSKCFDLGNKTLNPYVQERAIEIACKLYDMPSFNCNSLVKSNKELIKSFVKKYKQLQKKNITPKQDPQFYFHFAKSILLLNGHNKLRPLAVNSLKEIAGINQINKKNTLENDHE